MPTLWSLINKYFIFLQTSHLQHLNRAKSHLAQSLFSYEHRPLVMAHILQPNMLEKNQHFLSYL